MNIRGFYDLQRKTLARTLRDSSSAQVPTIVAGEDVRFIARFRETENGTPREIEPNVRSMKAHLGFVDTMPEQGTFKIAVDGEEIATALTFSYDSAADSETPGLTTLASEMVTAIQALTSFSGVTVEAEVRNDSIILTFPSDETTEHTFIISENRLYPKAFVRVRTYERGDRWEHELRFVMAPLASSSVFEKELAAIPEIYGLRDGGGTEDAYFSEIQALYIPPGFKGTFRIVRDGVNRSEPLSARSTLEDVQDAIASLADSGGVFNITIPVDDTAYIEFAGDMIGIDHPLMTVEIFDAPPAANAITIPTRTREMADWMQFTNRGTTWLEVQAEIEDPDTAGVYYWHTLFRQEVNVREAIDWDELATVPAVDWLNPPTYVNYNHFSPNQVSNGQIHYTTTLGDGTATSFVIDHGLDTNELNVIITENQSPGAAMVNGTDYSWEITNDNRVTITWLDGVPASAAYKVTVLGLVQTSFFDPHTHVIGDVEGLQEYLDNILARLAVLEVATGGSLSVTADGDNLETARWTLPDIFELYPSRVNPTRPESGSLTELDFSELREGTTSRIVGRGKGLLPAVHDATVGSMPSEVPPAPDSGQYAGQVLQNNTGGDLVLPGGGGNRTTTIGPGEFATTDGALIWYPLSQYGQYEGATVTANASTDKLSFSSGLDETLSEQTTVQFETTGTLPGGLVAGTDYTVFGADFQERSFQVKDSDGNVVDLTSAGTGDLTVVIEKEISYYPAHFERTLFTLHINRQQLQARKKLELGFHLEAAILRAADTEAQWNVVIEIGEARGVTTEGTEGDNLDEVVWRKIPALEQRLILTPLSSTHRFGLIVGHNITNGETVMDAQATAYGALLSPKPAAPASPDFLVRARLTRFDVEDNVENPRGYVIFSGLNLTNANEEEGSQANSAALEYGFAVIK